MWFEKEQKSGKSDENKNKDAFNYSDVFDEDADIDEDEDDVIEIDTESSALEQLSQKEQIAQKTEINKICQLRYGHIHDVSIEQVNIVYETKENQSGLWANLQWLQIAFENDESYFEPNFELEVAIDTATFIFEHEEMIQMLWDPRKKSE